MIDIKMTINGRPATAANIRNELERSVYEAFKQEISEKLRGIGPTADGERLQVELKGSNINSLSISLSGPDELVERAKEILGVQ